MAANAMDDDGSLLYPLVPCAAMPPRPWCHECPPSPLANRCSGLSRAHPTMPSAAAAAPLLSPPCFLSLSMLTALALNLAVVVGGGAFAFLRGASGCCAGGHLGSWSLLIRPPSDELRNRRRSLSRHLLHPALLEAGRAANGSAFLGGEPDATAVAFLLPSGEGAGPLVASRSAAAKGSKSVPEPTLLRRRGDLRAPFAIGDRGDDPTLPPSSRPGGGFSGLILPSSEVFSRGFSGRILPFSKSSSAVVRLSAGAVLSTTVPNSKSVSHAAAPPPIPALGVPGLSSQSNGTAEAVVEYDERG
ncbi:hypothetical protein VPH35_121931 [Triticum aestivum]